MTACLPAGLHLHDVTGDRYEDWLDRFLGRFGHAPLDPEMVDYYRATHPPERAIAVSDDAGYVATGSSLDRSVVLPGGVAVRMAGVTGLTVDPTARRQGLLSAMMAYLHRRAVEEERPIAGLGASEWPIYGRFGYGPATWFDSLSIETRAAGWPPEPSRNLLRPQRIATKEARDLAQTLHTHRAITTPGEVLQPAACWDRFAIGNASLRLDAVMGLADIDAGPRHCVAVDDRGFASYRIKSGWTTDSTPSDILQITDLVATDADSEASLWCHILSIDLVTEVRTPRVPVDDPLRWWVADARRLRPRRHDGLWLRPLDVPTLLQTRRWSGTGALTIAVHDPDGFAEGTFSLDVDTGHGSCQRTSASPDMEMDAAALGAILLGGTPATGLARSGRIRAPEPQSAQLWDSLATPERAPFLSTTF